MTIQEHLHQHDETYCDICFLTWLSNRIVTVYEESENVDFVQRVRRIAEKLLDDSYVGISK